MWLELSLILTLISKKLSYKKIGIKGIEQVPSLNIPNIYSVDFICDDLLNFILKYGHIVHTNSICIAKRVFNTVGLFDTVTYYVEEDFRNDEKMIFFGYKVVENEVIELDSKYREAKLKGDELRKQRNDISGMISFDYNEEDYMYCAEDITINYVGKGEYLWMPN